MTKCNLECCVNSYMYIFFPPQAASRLFRPAVLDEFLEAVTGLNAFCSDDQLKHMDLLSKSVKAQWEV